MAIAGKLGIGQSNGIGKKQLDRFPRFKYLIKGNGNIIHVTYSIPVEPGIVLINYGPYRGFSPFPIFCQMETAVKLFREPFCQCGIFIGIGMVPIVKIKGGKSFVRLVYIGKMLPYSYLMGRSIEGSHNFIGMLRRYIRAQ